MYYNQNISCLIISGVILIAAGGCSENLNSIYRTTDLDNRQSPVTDAKQRIITNTWASNTDGKNYPKRIICAEPSPDVAQALSSAISIAAQAEAKSTRADNSGRGASGQLGITQSTAASVAQLGERLGTIQLLRDSLYRTCEAYSNGAVSEATYAMIVGRIDETMVTLLATEAAAGAFGRPLAGIDGSAAANAGRVIADNERLVELDREISSLIEEKNKLPAGDEKRPGIEEQLAEKRGQRERALQLQSSSRASATANFSNSTIAAGSRVSNTNAEQITKIHRQFIEDDNLDGLMTACITSLSKSPSPRRPDEYNYVRADAAADLGSGGSAGYGYAAPAPGRPVRSSLTDVCQGMFERDLNGKPSLFENLVSAKLQNSETETRLNFKLQMAKAAETVVSKCVDAAAKNAVGICTAAGRMFVPLGREK